MLTAGIPRPTWRETLAIDTIWLLIVPHIGHPRARLLRCRSMREFKPFELVTRTRSYRGGLWYRAAADDRLRLRIEIVRGELSPPSSSVDPPPTHRAIHLLAGALLVALKQHVAAPVLHPQYLLWPPHRGPRRAVFTAEARSARPARGLIDRVTSKKVISLFSRDATGPPCIKLSQSGCRAAARRQPTVDGEVRAGVAPSAPRAPGARGATRLRPRDRGRPPRASRAVAPPPPGVALRQIFGAGNGPLRAMCYQCTRGTPGSRTPDRTWSARTLVHSLLFFQGFLP